MDEKDMILPEDDFNLEDILKEFADEPLAVEDEPETLSIEDTVAETVEQVAAEQIAVKIDEPEEIEQTVRLDEISEHREATVRVDAVQIEEDEPQPLLDQTVRLDEIPAEHPQPISNDTIRMEPSDDDTGRWEPDYSRPYDGYIPAQPIIFRPRSRLRELKRKLVAGPEKRYYELSEMGVGKLQLAIIMNLLVVLLSAGATAMQAMGWVGDNRMKLMVFGQFFAMLVSALLGSYQLMDGVIDLTKKRFTLNTLLVFTFIACCADGVFCLQQVRIPCCAAFSLQMTMSLLSAYHRRVIELGQMDTMRKATRLDSLAAAPDYYEGRTGILRGEGEVEDFMDNYQQMTGPEKTVGIYAVIALLASIALGVTGAVLMDIATGVQVLAVSLLAAAPATFFISLSRPEALLEKRLHRLGTVLCGWQGIRELSKRVVFPVSHDDLFPGGCLKMNGVKFYGNRNPDQVVEFATALIREDGNGLVPLFDALLESRSGHRYEVENFRVYNNGGIGGEICGEPVLVGVMSFLKEMGVEIPEGTRVNQAVYMAIDGELCGLFAVTYDKVKSSAQGLGTLCSYRGLKTVLTAGDFMLTESFIRGKFGVNTRRMAFPEQDIRDELREKVLEEDAPALAITTRDGLAPMAYAVSGARSLRTAWTVGSIVHMIAGAIGLAMMLVLTVLGQVQLLTPVNMFLYELVWLIPGLLITEWTRSI